MTADDAEYTVTVEEGSDGNAHDAGSGADALTGGAEAKANVYLVAGIVTAAVVSAATAGYIVWRNAEAGRAAAESVQGLLDKAHRTLHLLEERLGDIPGGRAAGDPA